VPPSIRGILQKNGSISIVTKQFAIQLETVYHYYLKAVYDPVHGPLLASYDFRLLAKKNDLSSAE